MNENKTVSHVVTNATEDCVAEAVNQQQCEAVKQAVR